MKYHLAQVVPFGLASCDWFAILGSAFDNFSLYAVPGEADRSGRDVVRLQTNALLLYEAAGKLPLVAKVCVRYVRRIGTRVLSSRIYGARQSLFSSRVDAAIFL